MHLGANSHGLVTSARGKHTTRVPQRVELRGLDSQLSALCSQNHPPTHPPPCANVDVR